MNETDLDWLLNQTSGSVPEQYALILSTGDTGVMSPILPEARYTSGPRAGESYVIIMSHNIIIRYTGTVLHAPCTRCTHCPVTWQYGHGQSDPHYPSIIRCAWRACTRPTRMVCSIPVRTVPTVPVRTGHTWYTSTTTWNPNGSTVVVSYLAMRAILN